MGRFAIVTDGSVTLPEGFAKAQQVAIAHDHISFGMDSFTPYVDLTHERYYELIRTRKEHPSTSQPSLGDIRDAYEAALKYSNEVLVITVDATRSGTFGTMSTAAQSLPGRFEMIDSRSVSGGLGLMVMAAARARQQGRSLDEAAALVRGMAAKVNLIAYIDTLEFLKKSGRVSAVQALVGSILSVRPLLRFAGGEPVILDRVRTRSRGLARLREVVATDIGEGSRAQVYVLHTNSPDDGRELGAWARRTFHCVEYFEQDAGPVLATHVGPGVIALAFVKED
jgi:DegV family protein with EDD domain